ncbi:zinc finger protein 184-like isoform X2 [Sitophilus oryzae]|uniref:Zinc finger protein 184-like isoform X2 n=1 Tax=Sitophilus oryzae TaxID=7048 RepID=A0A6J2YCU6_SITOR|nr:zinc finger protein 184-like isoform X2 [Sitophilus oryzae]
MKYVKRYNKYNLQTKCRICLTQPVGPKIRLEDPLRGEIGPKPTVHEALEQIVSEKVRIKGIYPNTICAMCAEFLRIAYDLKIQYQTSRQNLDSMAEEIDELSSDEDTENANETGGETQAPVEIVVGSQKFDLKNLVIVEDEVEDNIRYDGFLQNLGTAISATFVNKKNKKKRLEIEPPSIVIEKVIEKMVNNETEITDIEYYTIEEEEEQQIEENTGLTDEYSVEREGEDNEAVEEIETVKDLFEISPANTNLVDQFVIETENDRKALESALNMKYKCIICNKPMRSLTRMKQHINICRKRKQLKCYNCGEYFESRRILLQHMKTNHINEIKDKCIDQVHECSVCHQSFSSYGSLAYHMTKHQGKQFTCNICDKPFYTKSQVDIHMQIHNKDKKIAMCSICGKTFHYQSGLFYHMKMHNNERKYKCTYCDRRFYTSNSIKRHELTHTGARPYACKYCDKKFRSLGEVKKHHFLHTGERPYNCDYCNMSFIQAHNLKLHLMTHSGDYHCIYCPKTFAEEASLKLHMSQRHQINETDDLSQETDDISQETDHISQEIEFNLEEDETGMCEDQFETVRSEEDLLNGEVLEQEYFIMEDEFVSAEEGAMSEMIVKTYEVQNEVLVEAIEDPS